MLDQIHGYVKRGGSFAFETTLSGKVYARLIPKWRAEGYVVKLFFLALPSVELAIERVKNRVRQGGHDVQATVIRRRFAAGSKNKERIMVSIRK